MTAATRARSRDASPGSYYVGRVRLTVLSGFLLAPTLACSTSLSVPRVVTGYGGVSGMTNTSLARTTATNRALAAASWLLEVDGVTFEYVAAAGASSLELARAGAPLKGVNTSLIEISPGSWVGVSKLERPKATVAAMSALPMVEVIETADHADVGRALDIARAKAIRALVVAALGAEASLEGRVAGTVTLADVVVDASAEVHGEAGAMTAVHHVRLHAWGRASLGAKTPLTDEARRETLAVVVAGARALGELDRAVVASAARLVLAPTDAGLLAEHAGLLEEAGQLAAAASALQKSFELEPTALDRLERAAALLARAGDQATATALEQRVAALRAEQAAAAETATAAEAEKAAAEKAAAEKAAAEKAAADKAAEEAAKAKAGKKPAKQR
jgi:hypothetical protein